MSGGIEHGALVDGAGASVSATSGDDAFCTPSCYRWASHVCREYSVCPTRDDSQGLRCVVGYDLFIGVLATVPDDRETQVTDQ